MTTEKMVAALMESIAPILHAHIKKQIERAVEPLRERIKELEVNPPFSYRGIWNATETYGSNSFVTSAGSVWFSKRANTATRPGTDPSAWVLAVKRGADGKDLR